MAVIKAYVGLATEDTSGAEFKFGSLVRPGHRGIWQEPLRTGKYADQPALLPGGDRADGHPHAELGRRRSARRTTWTRSLQQIVAKSREGFVFKIDLQVQIHVPDTKAPRVISMVGTMQNLVNEVLQAAVGNHFRDKLQSMPAIHVHRDPPAGAGGGVRAHHASSSSEYEVETKGVYIQDVILPEDLVQVLTAARNRQPGDRDLQEAEGGPGAAHRRPSRRAARPTCRPSWRRLQVGVEIKQQRERAESRGRR